MRKNLHFILAILISLISCQDKSQIEKNCVLKSYIEIISVANEAQKAVNKEDEMEVTSKSLIEIKHILKYRDFSNCPESYKALINTIKIEIDEMTLMFKNMKKIELLTKKMEASDSEKEKYKILRSIEKLYPDEDESSESNINPFLKLKNFVKTKLNLTTEELLLLDVLDGNIQ